MGAVLSYIDTSANLILHSSALGAYGVWTTEMMGRDMSQPLSAPF
jgi:hypothetical protein